MAWISRAQWRRLEATVTHGCDGHTSHDDSKGQENVGTERQEEDPERRSVPTCRKERCTQAPEAAESPRRRGCPG